MSEISLPNSTHPSYHYMKNEVQPLTLSIITYAFHHYLFLLFIDESGSCRKRSDCPLRTQPYCSGYGFCTQSQDYGTDGCQDNCPKPSYAKY